VSARYPFGALVGQDAMLAALLLGAVEPAVGGVLARGHKGTGKSTAVRALGTLLARAGAGRLVEVPLNATEDRLVGALAVEEVLREGRRVFEAGLLAAADGGVLYVDEVNLLPDHLVDMVLDAAASGVNVVERDGLSEVHRARFLLVGTMNPEEGELRPQFLDRFGLCVDVATEEDGERRAEVVRRHLAWQADPDGFAARYDGAEAELVAALVAARLRLAEGAVAVPDDVIGVCVELARSVGAQGHRAELTLVKASRARAALMGRAAATGEDVADVATMALVHRAAASLLDDGATRARRVAEAMAAVLGGGGDGASDEPWDREWGVDHDAVEAMQIPGSAAAGSTLISYLKKKR